MFDLTVAERKMHQLVEVGASLKYLTEHLKNNPDLTLNFIDSAGRTLLFYCRSVAMAQWLIKKGRIDPFLKDRDGSSVIHMATAYNNKDLVDFYLNCGLSVSVKNKEGVTPLLCASTLGLKSMANFLQSRGASFFETDHEGFNALHLASCHRAEEHISFVKMLLDEKGLDINKTDKKGNNALHLLMDRFISQKYMMFLLSKGINPTATNNEGKTPLDVLMDRDFRTRSYHREYIILLRKAMNEWVIKQEEKTPFSLSEIARACNKEVDVHLVDDLIAQKTPQPAKPLIKTVYYAVDDDTKMMIKRAINSGHNLIVNNVLFTKETIKLLNRSVPTKKMPKILDVSTIERQ